MTQTVTMEVLVPVFFLCLSMDKNGLDSPFGFELHVMIYGDLRNKYLRNDSSGLEFFSLNCYMITNWTVGLSKIDENSHLKSYPNLGGIVSCSKNGG